MSISVRQKLVARIFLFRSVTGRLITTQSSEMLNLKFLSFIVSFLLHFSAPPSVFSVAQIEWLLFTFCLSNEN